MYLIRNWGNELRLTVDSNIDQSGIFLLNYVNKDS